jgi:hypothetical protein
MKRITLGLFVMLAGCGIAQQAQISQQAHDAYSRREAAFSACKEQFPKRGVARTKCINAADLEYHLAMQRSVAHPGLDIVQLSHARQLALAEKLENKQISETEYDIESSRILAEANSQLQARVNNAMIASAAQQQAIAARQQAALQTMAAGAAIMSGGLSTASTPMPTTTSCRPLGGTIHCTHY